ncbi:MAG: replicative DNA helicase [Malacoplasma sp.]
MNDNILDLDLNKDFSIDEIEKIILANSFNVCKETEEIFLNLKPEDFELSQHRLIFAVLEKLWAENKKVDVLSVINFISTNNEFQFEDFVSYIIGIDSKFAFQQNIVQYIDIIKNNSIKRKFSDFAKTLEDTNLDVISAKDKLWNLEKQFLNITSNKKTKQIEQIGKIVEEYNKKLEQLLNQTDELTGITSGFPSIDKITNGFQGGDLIILAARPGVGKTALGINFILNAAKSIKDKAEIEPTKSTDKQDIVLMFSMEMGNIQICHRIVSIESGVNMNLSRKANLDSMQWTSISESISKLYNMPLYIDDSSDLTIMDIQSKVKQLSNEKNIKLIVVDYLQLLKESRKSVNINRQQEVANISRSLKSIARQIDAPIIAIAQLSRKIEERKGDGKKPLLSDLRESGAIEQDADLVCFLSYKEEVNENKKDFNNVIVDFMIAKNRNGAIGNVDLLFVKSLSKYYDASLNYEKDYTNN